MMNDDFDHTLRRALRSVAETEVPAATPVPPLTVPTAAPRRWVLPAAAALVVLLGIGVTYAVTRPAAQDISTTTPTSAVPPSAPATVTVPDLTGLSELEAVNLLATLGLTADFTTAVSTDTEIDRVVGQNPSARTIVEPSSVVEVTIGTGQARTVVPELVGLTYVEAAELLQQADLVPVRTDKPSTRPLGEVIGLEGLQVGDNVPVGSPVEVEVSDQSLFLMPDLTGLTVDAAIASLQSLGWTGTNLLQTATPADSAQVGRVVAGGSACVQQPQTGAEATASQQIVVCVGSPR